MCAMAPAAKLTILPSVSMLPRTPVAAGRGGAAAGRRAGRTGVATAMLVSPQHVVGVEQRQHRRCVQVLEDLDADEARDDRLVHGARHTLRSTARRDALVAADRRDEHA